MLEFFYIVGLKFYTVISPTSHWPHLVKKKGKNPTEQKGQRYLQVAYKGKREVSVGDYITLVLV